MAFYDYRCVNGHEHNNLLRKYEERTIECPECGAEANRLYTFRFIAHGLDNGHIAAPNTARRSVVQKNPNDKRIDPNIYKTKTSEE